MKTEARLAFKLMLPGSVAALICWLAAFPTLATAQGSQGQDAWCPRFAPVLWPLT